MKLKNPVCFLFIVSFLFLNSLLNAQWNWQNPLPQGNLLRAMCFPDDLTGYAAGEAGTVMKSTDSGQTWSVLGFLDTKDFYCMDFIDDQTGIIAGEKGMAMITTNGGMTWNAIEPLNARDIISIEMTDESTIYLVSGDSLVRSSDGGQNWESMELNPSGSYCKVLFVTPEHGIVGGFDANNNVVIFHSIDGGENWTYIDPGIGKTGLYDFSFVDETTGFLGGADSPLFKTTDGGYSWIQSGDEIKYFGDIHFSDPLNGKAIIAGWLQTTDDGGMTWTTDDFPFYYSLWELAATPSGNLFASGSGGSILKYDSAGHEWLVCSGGMSLRLSYIQVSDEGIGLILGDEYVLHSDNFGMTWAWQKEQAMYSPIAASFLGPDTGWILTGSHNTAMTLDGGYTWTSGKDQPVSKNLSFNDLAFSDFTNGFKVGVAEDEFGDRHPIVHRTTDGDFWDVFAIPQATGELNRILFLNNETGFILGDNGQILKTEDGGDNWYGVNYQQNLYLNDVCFIGGQIAYACGEIRFSPEVGILKSTDAGESWTMIYSSDEVGSAGAIAFTDSLIGYVIAGSDLIKTSDGGISWQVEVLHCDNGLKDICLIDNENVLLVGDNQTILKKGNMADVPGSLAQNNGIKMKISPNPSERNPSLHYFLNDKGFVEIWLYDLHGKKIRHLLSENQQQGEKVLPVNTTGLPDGIYLIQLRCGMASACAKLIVKN
jgi:photosystem II stability/assembly factor-like uncharacterized protein